MTTLYSRSTDVLWRNAGDRVLLRSLRGEGLITIEGSGTLMWELLAEPVTLDDLVTSMAVHYRVERSVVRDAVERALTDLEGAHLVETHDAQRSGRSGAGDGASLPTQVSRAAH